MNKMEVNKYYTKLSEMPQTFKNKIVRYFPDTNLSGGFDRLSAIAKRNRIDVSSLAFGEYLIFVNKKRDKLKMLCGNDLVAYLRLPNGARIDLRTIALIPRFFNGTAIEYDRALREVLEKQLGSKPVVWPGEAAYAVDRQA